MKALVCPNEPVTNGYRIAQIESDDKIFVVAEPLYWMDCSDEVVPDFWYYDVEEQIIKQVTKIIIQQPTTTGSQTL